MEDKYGYQQLMQSVSRTLVHKKVFDPVNNITIYILNRDNFLHWFNSAILHFATTDAVNAQNVPSESFFVKGLY